MSSNIRIIFITLLICITCDLWASSPIYLNLAQKYGTPIYVYNLKIIRSQLNKLKKYIKYEPKKILYAMKANYHPLIIKDLHDLGLGMDAVSFGEVLLALKLGVPKDQILYTENNITDKEIEKTLSKEVMINCGSLDCLYYLARKSKLTKIVTSVRFNPGRGTSSHKKILTAGKGSKFGIDIRLLSKVLKIQENFPNLKIVGVHVHVGSGSLSHLDFLESIDKIFSLASHFSNLKFVDVGGGLGVPYKKNEREINIKKIGQVIAQKMEILSRKMKKKLELRIEPGRYLTAKAGVLLATTTSVKEDGDGHIQIGINTGFNHLMRPILYNAYHQIINLSNKDGHLIKVDIVGNICEGGDVFQKDYALQKTLKGDILAITHTGAYGMSMASNYNLRAKPSEVVIDGDTVLSLNLRKSEEELVSQMLLEKF